MAEHVELEREGFGEVVEGGAADGGAVVGAGERAERGGLGGEEAEVALAGFEVALLRAGGAGGVDLFAVDLAAGEEAEAEHGGAEQEEVEGEGGEGLVAGESEAGFEDGGGAGGEGGDGGGAGGGEPGEEGGGGGCRGAGGAGGCGW
ncbi:MAG: hypothetical protein R3F65_14495 [bacterium]